MKSKRQKNQDFLAPRFFPKSRRAALEKLVKTIVWIVVFVGLVIAVYFLIKFLTTM